MAPSRKRSPPWLDAATADDTNGEGSCEPPSKKPRQSQYVADSPSSQFPRAREHSQTLSPRPPEFPTKAAGTDVIEESDDGDDFEPLEELLMTPLRSDANPATGVKATSPLQALSDVAVKSNTPQIHAVQRDSITPTTTYETTTDATPASYTGADFKMPKIDVGEESDDAMVIDLTQDDAEVHVGRSDGFIGIIKPGTPGITVKREGSFQPTPMRHALSPLSTNTPSSYKQNVLKSPSSPKSRLSEPRQAHTYLGRPKFVPVSIPENAENAKPHCFSPTPSSSLDMPKQEDTEIMEQDILASLFKLDDESKKTERRRLTAKETPTEYTKSSGLDMAKFLLNEQTLSAMPCAVQPHQLKTKLLKHQRQALQWMVDMEKPHHPVTGPSTRLAQFWGRKLFRNVDDGDLEALGRDSVVPFSGGILADDMGLGKTLEMISLILAEPGGGPSLIVAPKGVLTNWESQIRRHILWNHAPRVLRYHGASGFATSSELERNHIVITTYNKLGDEARSKGSLRKVQWRRVILDEGHNIRNPDCLAALAACQLQAKSYWVCTGTPIINSVNDIVSLGRFIGATATLGKTPADIIRRLKNDHEFLQHVMATTCLRRTKEMGFINLELPPKHEKLIRIVFSEAEKAMYDKLLVDAQAAAEMFFKTRRYDLWTHLLVRLLRLRQMCNHWSLCKKQALNSCRKDLHSLLRQGRGVPSDLQLDELLHLSLETKIACGICNEPVNLETIPVIVPCAHTFCKACLLIPFKDTIECPLCKNIFRVESIKELDSVPSSAYEVPNQFDHSSKTKTLINLVHKRLRNKGSKIVIFSQWTSFLDVVSHWLGEEGIGYARIDGTMSTSLRDEAMHDFNSDANVRVMLASLRAAGVGISLVAADTAILADSWWAPAVEEQAVDRIHRLGQTRPTKVYRLVIKDAVEENVIRIQDRKRELVGTAFQEGFKALSSVSFSGIVKELLR